MQAEIDAPPAHAVATPDRIDVIVDGNVAADAAAQPKGDNVVDSKPVDQAAPVETSTHAVDNCGAPAASEGLADAGPAAAVSSNTDASTVAPGETPATETVEAPSLMRKPSLLYVISVLDSPVPSFIHRLH